MQPRVHIITLGVSDLDRAKHFYVDGLGWPAMLHVPDEVIFVQVGPGLLLGLFTGLAEDAGVAGFSDPASAPISLAHNVDTEDQVATVLAQAKASGGTIVKQAQPSAVGFVHGYFRDPFGFLWEIACNPGLTFHPDGRIEFAEPTG